MNTWNPMSIEELKISFLIIAWVFVMYWIAGNFNFWWSSSRSDRDEENFIDEFADITEQKSQEKFVKDLKKKIEREEIALEEMDIKREDIENKIEALYYATPESIDIEKKNEMEMRKLNLQLRQLAWKTEERRENLSALKQELWII